MFSVFLYQMADACEKLNELAKRQRREIQNLEEVISALGHLSGMEEIIGALKTKKNESEEQLQNVFKMIQGLEKIRLYYYNAEKRICENGDGCRYVYRNPDITMAVTNLDPDKIKEVSFLL